MGKIEKEYIQLFTSPVQNLRDIYFFNLFNEVNNIVHIIYFNKCEDKSFQHLELQFSLCLSVSSCLFFLLQSKQFLTCLIVLLLHFAVQCEWDLLDFTWNYFAFAVNGSAMPSAFCLICGISVIFPLFMLLALLHSCFKCMFQETKKRKKKKEKGNLMICL